MRRASITTGRRAAVVALAVSLLACGAETSSSTPHGGADTSDTSKPGVDARPAVVPASVVVFGGDGTTGTWSWNGAAWDNNDVSGPPERSSAAMATLNGEAVMYGGYFVRTTGPGADFDDTWVWSGTAWSKQSVVGPPARFGASMATLNGVVVLFGGGTSNNQFFGDTWIWNGATWAKRGVAGPTPRVDAVMARSGNTLILFGGCDGSGALADTWTWDGAAWNNVHTSGPPARYQSTMATLGSSVVLFGGVSGPGEAPDLDDTWTWDGTRWTQRVGNGPSARDGAAMATLKDTVILFGGGDSHTDKGALDVPWIWDGTRWASSNARGPAGGSQASMASVGTP